MSIASKTTKTKHLIPPPPPPPPSPPLEEEEEELQSKSKSPPSSPTPQSSSMCTADSADLNSSECTGSDDSQLDDFSPKKRTVSNSSTDTVSTTTLTAAEEEDDDDEDDNDDAIKRASSPGIDAIKRELSATQEQLIQKNRALQALLRDVALSTKEDLESYPPLPTSSSLSTSNINMNNNSAAALDSVFAAVTTTASEAYSLDFSEVRSCVSSPGKMSLRERLQRRIRKTSKKIPSGGTESDASDVASTDDGESVSSSVVLRRHRKRLFKKNQNKKGRTTNDDTMDKEDSNKSTDYEEEEEDTTSDILGHYTSSLSDDYTLDKKCLFPTNNNDSYTNDNNNDDDDDDDNDDENEESKQVQNRINMMRKRNINAHQQHQCRKSRNKALLDAMLNDISAHSTEFDNDDDDEDESEEDEQAVTNNAKPPTSKKDKKKHLQKRKKVTRNVPTIKSNKPNTTPSSEALLRLSRQVRFGRRGELPAQKNRVNKVKMHVYDLIASETIVPMPWGCDFPLGKCFSAVNDTLHALGTGAYHVGVEVNGIEYAFGANSIEGLSGVFTAIPKMSPGYEYRTTVDFGDRRTIRKSWISVPKVECMDLIMSRTGSASSSSYSPTTPSTPSKRTSKYQAERSLSTNDVGAGTTKETEGSSSPISSPDRNAIISKNEGASAMTPLRANGAVAAKSSAQRNQASSFTSEKVPCAYREVETFVDGHSVMVELSREYMGVDYDLLRKNCCTFAHEALIRLGVPKEEIPTWFYNVAEAGAATEDAVKDMEENVISPLRRMISGSVEDEAEEDSKGEEEQVLDPEPEHCSENNGFEVIAKSKRGSVHKTEMEIVRVVEAIVGNGKKSGGLSLSSPRGVASPGGATHDVDDDDSIGIRHTLSWTY